MSTVAASFAHRVSPKDRLEVLFDRLAELNGQRNAIDGRIVEIVAEIDRDGLGGMTGARSIPALVAWKTGVSPRNAKTIAAIAHRITEFPTARKACGKADSPWTKSASSPRRRPTVPTSTTHN